MTSLQKCEDEINGRNGMLLQKQYRPSLQTRLQQLWDVRNLMNNGLPKSMSRCN